jgi:prepilin-type processing-associated H-X9-DG protein
MEPEEPTPTPSPVPLDYARPQRPARPIALLPAISVLSGLLIVPMTVMLLPVRSLFDLSAFILVPLLAITAGAISLRSHRARQDRLCAMLGVLLGLGGIWAGVMGHYESINRIYRAHQVRCASNLRQIGLASIMYSNEHQGQFPDSIATVLATQDISTDVFLCPACIHRPASGVLPEVDGPVATSYVYVGAAMHYDLEIAGTVILVYEPISNHNGRGMNVLFGDAHVEWWEAERAEKLIAELEAGHNPPRAEKLE